MCYDIYWHFSLFSPLALEFKKLLQSWMNHRLNLVLSVSLFLVLPFLLPLNIRVYIYPQLEMIFDFISFISFLSSFFSFPFTVRILKLPILNSFLSLSSSLTFYPWYYTESPQVLKKNSVFVLDFLAACETVSHSLFLENPFTRVRSSISLSGGGGSPCSLMGGISQVGPQLFSFFHLSCRKHTLSKS